MLDLHNRLYDAYMNEYKTYNQRLTECNKHILYLKDIRTDDKTQIAEIMVGKEQFRASYWVLRFAVEYMWIKLTEANRLGLIGEMYDVLNKVLNNTRYIYAKLDDSVYSCNDCEATSNSVEGIEHKEDCLIYQMKVTLKRVEEQT